MLTYRYNKDFSDQEMVTAADIANAKEFIENDEIDNNSKKPYFNL